MQVLGKHKYIYLGALSVFFIVVAILVALKIYHSKKAEQNTNLVISESLAVKELKLKVVHTSTPEKGLVIYIADSNKPHKSETYAKKFADLSYYVAQINSSDFLSYLNNHNSGCLNIAEQLLAISTELQTHYEIDSDNLPILVGNDESAALVYSALAQADKNQFHAGISINFRAAIQTTPVLCNLNNLTSNNNSSTITPAKHLSSSWYIFQDIKNTNDASATEFINHVRNARLTQADLKNSDALSEAIQILQWLDPRLSDQISSDTGDGNLPLIEVPSELNTTDTMAIILTGDGGWAEIDKNIAQLLAEKGIPTVALDSLSYFWRAHTPTETAKDIDGVITEYREKWHKEHVILIGYSFGADVLPFVANNLSEKSKANIDLVAMLGMGNTAAFEFRLSSWMNADKNPNRLPVLPEIKHLGWAPSICIYGLEDPDTICNTTSKLGLKSIAMKGDHHFDKNYTLLVNTMLENAKHPIAIPLTESGNGQ